MIIQINNKSFILPMVLPSVLVFILLLDPSGASTCADTILRFQVNWKEKIIMRDCRWVANRATIQRCNVPGVSTACPATCGTCSICKDTTLRFKVHWNGKKIMRDCIWIGNRAPVQRCNIVGVADACRVTCKVPCSSKVPSQQPSPFPTSSGSISASSAEPSLVQSDTPSSPPSLLPSSSPSKSPTSQPSSQPSISSQPSLQPSSQPSNCFSSVLYEPQGDIQVLSSGYSNDRNGYSISLSADGTIMAVSAILYPESFGSVTVYEKNVINSQVVEWNLKGQLITGQQGFGVNIELSNDGNTLVVGNPMENSGVARVYRFNNNLNDWTKLGQDIVENDSTVAGFAVAISGNGQVVAVGDPDYGIGKGRVKVYEFDSSIQDWVERGPSIDGSSSFGEFGYAVSLSVNGNVVACGAPRGGTTVWNISGSVRVLGWDPTFSRWNMLGQELESFTEFLTIRFGQKISIAEDETKPRIAIASVDSTVMNLDKSGRVSVWEYDANFQFWMQVGDDMVGTPNGNQKFGSSVSIAGDGSHVAVGVPIFAKGSAHVYFWNGGVWDESNTLSGNDYESGFGHSVDLSKDGNTLAVGASSQFWKGYSQVFMSNKDCEYVQ